MTKDISLSSRPSPGSFSSIFGMERSFPSWHLDKFVWATFSRPQQTGVPSDGTRRNVQLEKKLSRKTAVRIIWNQRCYPWYLFLIQHQEYYVTMKNGSCETTHKKVCVDWDVPCCCCHTFQSRYTEKRFIVFSRAIGFWHVFVVFLFLHRKSKLADASNMKKKPTQNNQETANRIKFCQHIDGQNLLRSTCSWLSLNPETANRRKFCQHIVSQNLLRSTCSWLSLNPETATRSKFCQLCVFVCLCVCVFVCNMMYGFVCMCACLCVCFCLIMRLHACV